jgi:hypothetical protein
LAQIFPEWTNKLPSLAVGLVVLLLFGIIGFFWYYGSPKYLDVGYRPHQPIDYSHKLHAGDLGLDCRYCHSDIEISPVANVPPTQTCMNCHRIIGTESSKLVALRESWSSGKPIQWVRVHKVPDYAYFNHAAHLRAGVGCSSCHGNIADMQVVEQKKPLSMGWCLDCHRDPTQYIRPASEITNMQWIPPPDQEKIASRIIAEKHINPPKLCSGCHR